MDARISARPTGTASTTSVPPGLGGLAKLLKVLGHDGRLRLLWHLARGDRSVSELEALLGQRQPAVSQQLARLRRAGLVETRRKGKAIIYSLANGPTRPLVERILAAIPTGSHPG
ncbi:MAG: winged helix-turn-helix transcriptional regulator [Gammaproteobacteria bacterium]|nr:winged helix-turn-helix transcriptional regulator [Gammaproteobacteria bacterium]